MKICFPTRRNPRGIIRFLHVFKFADPAQTQKLISRPCYPPKAYTKCKDFFSSSQVIFRGVCVSGGVCMCVGVGGGGVGVGVCVCVTNLK